MLVLRQASDDLGPCQYFFRASQDPHDKRVGCNGIQKGVVLIQYQIDVLLEVTEEKSDLFRAGSPKTGLGALG